VAPRAGRPKAGPARGPRGVRMAQAGAGTVRRFPPGAAALGDGRL